MQKKLLFPSVLAGLMILVSFARAEKVDEPICVDLHRASCASGEITDPTGVSRNLPFTFGPAHPIHAELRSEMKAQALELLKDQKFLRLVMKLGAPDECASNVSAEPCLNALAQNLALKVEARFITGQTVPELSVGNEGKIQDLLAVLSSSQVDQMRQKAFASFKAKFTEDELIAKAEKEIFPRVKESALAQAQALIGDEKARELVTNRLKAIEWGGGGCGAEPLALMMAPDVFLNPLDNKIHMCRGISRLGTSEYMIAYLIAREIGHFVGPCGITQGKNIPTFKYTSAGNLDASENEFPYHGVLACLRSRSSVYAQRGLGLSNEPVAFCDKSDQISESFSDWFATETLADYTKRHLDKISSKEKKFGWINAMKSQCLPTSGLELADRPPVEERFNRILLAHPVVRSEMGCSLPLLDATYCAVVVPTSEGKAENAEAGRKKNETRDVDRTRTFADFILGSR